VSLSVPHTSQDLKVCVQTCSSWNLVTFPTRYGTVVSGGKAIWWQAPLIQGRANALWTKATCVYHSVRLSTHPCSKHIPDRSQPTVLILILNTGKQTMSEVWLIQNGSSVYQQSPPSQQSSIPIINTLLYNHYNSCHHTCNIIYTTVSPLQSFSIYNDHYNHQIHLQNNPT